MRWVGVLLGLGLAACSGCGGEAAEPGTPDVVAVSDLGAPAEIFVDVGPDAPAADVPDTRDAADIIDASPDTADIPAAVDVPPPRPCPTAGSGVTIGVVAPADLTEISGVAVSRRQPGVLWVHNDSGAGATVHALSELGDERVRYELASAKANDWEDIALGPYPGAEGDFLYLGDIGDNDRKRMDIGVYVVAEPDVASAAGPVVEQPIDHYLPLAYPDEPHDAETLFVDPVGGALFVLTKAFDGQSKLFRYAPPFVPDQRATLQLAAELELADFIDLTKPLGIMTTGGDIAPDGSLVLVRTYEAVWAWRRAPGQTVGEALAGEVCELETQDERQGEAISFTADGKGYVTISEDPTPPIYRFQLLLGRR